MVAKHFGASSQQRRRRSAATQSRRDEHEQQTRGESERGSGQDRTVRAPDEACSLHEPPGSASAT